MSVESYDAVDDGTDGCGGRDGARGVCAVDRKQLHRHGRTRRLAAEN